MSSLVRVLLSLPQLLTAIVEIANWVERWNRDRVIRDGRLAVDETTRTGDQSAEEKSLGGIGGGASSEPLPGLQSRPAKTRD